MDTFGIILAIVALVFCAASLGYGISDNINITHCKEGRPMVINSKIYVCKEVTWQNQ